MYTHVHSLIKIQCSFLHFSQLKVNEVRPQYLTKAQKLKSSNLTCYYNTHPSYREKNCRKQRELHLVLLLTSNCETFCWAEGSMLREVFQPTKLTTLSDHFSSSPRPTDTSVGDRKRWLMSGSQKWERMRCTQPHRGK